MMESEVSPWATLPLEDDAQPEPEADERAGEDASDEKVAIAAPRPASLIARATSSSPGASLCWVSVSGGAGSTSLAHINGDESLTACWPEPSRGWPSTVVLVARSNIASLNAAGRFLQEAVARSVPDLDVVGLVVSADAPGRMPRAVKARISELGALTTVWALPWVSQWREHPYSADPAAEKVVATVAALISPEEK